MSTIQLFKICYHWYEGEYQETLLGKDVTEKEFEKEIREAKQFAESMIGKQVSEGPYLGKGYSVECLPEYYDQIIWFLVEKKKYVACSLDEDVEYYVKDGIAGKSVAVQKKVKKIEWQKIKNKEEKSSPRKITIEHSYSHNFAGLQFADILAWVCFQKFEHDKSTYINLLTIGQEVYLVW